MSNMTIGNLPTPSKMPASQIQRIKNLQCPPPLMPSKATPRIREMYQQMQKQQQQITNLEKQLNDLETRYKVSFSANPEIKYDLKPGELPYIDVSGQSVKNIILEFHMWPACNGLQGIQGEQGEQGVMGANSVEQGRTGPTGYYGIRGDSLK